MRNFQGIVFNTNVLGDFQICISVPLNNKNIQMSLWNIFYILIFNLLSANPTKWSNTLKQFVVALQANCLSVFDLLIWLMTLKDTHNLQRNSCENENISFAI